MKDNEPTRDISWLSFEELARGSNGEVIAAAFHGGPEKHCGTALGIPGVRSALRKVASPAAGEGES